MSMTVGELITILETLDEDAEVRIASQPSWPFEYSVSGVTTKSRCANDYEEPEDIRDIEESPDDVVFIVEGQQLCYGSKRTFERDTHIRC